MKTKKSLKTLLAEAIKARINCDRYHWSKRQVEPRDRDFLQYKVETESDESLKNYCRQNWEKVRIIIPGNREKTIKEVVFDL